VIHEIIAVMFVTTSQNAPGRFTVPAEVCAALGIDKGARVEIEIDSPRGHFGPVTRELKSDREPAPVGEMRDWMRAGEEVTVTVRRG
jgi:bifunctional DNA-binding transcriptional regulator/antitoxin component of YhaV-PrlF toxin-antitoxin module